MLCSWGGGPWVRVSGLNICLQSAAPRPDFLEFFYSIYLRELLFVSVSTPAADVGWFRVGAYWRLGVASTIIAKNKSNREGKLCIHIIIEIKTLQAHFDGCKLRLCAKFHSYPD